MSRYNLRSASRSNTTSNIVTESISISSMKEETISKTIDNEKDNGKNECENIKNIDNLDIDSKLLDKEYLDKDKVILEDVDEDGACLYECLSRGLMYNDTDLVLTKKSLMNLCREYIQINQNKIVHLPNDLKMKFSELIETTHDMTIENYIKRYTRVNSRNWGGIPEIIVVSKIFNIEINVYIEDSIGYRKEYSIPVQKNPFIKNSINLLLDLSNEFAHYQLIIK